MICDRIFCPYAVYTASLIKDLKYQRYKAIKNVTTNNKPTEVSVDSFYLIHYNKAVVPAFANSWIKCQENGGNIEPTKDQETCVDAFHVGLVLGVLKLVGFSNYKEQRQLKQDVVEAC